MDVILIQYCESENQDISKKAADLMGYFDEDVSTRAANHCPSPDVPL